MWESERKYSADSFIVVQVVPSYIVLDIWLCPYFIIDLIIWYYYYSLIFVLATEAFFWKVYNTVEISHDHTSHIPLTHKTNLWAYDTSV